MTVFPNAKINIGLTITGKRSDGYHNIETVLYPLKIYDVLEIIPNPDGEGLEFSISGESLAIPEEENLCVKAFRLLEERYRLPAVKMHLHKDIPSGAGLGGGSSDAAYTLRLLNDLFGLGISREGLKDYARLLGSDCAFFIDNEPVYAFGKGDDFRPVRVDLSDYFLVVVMPDLAIATARAYAGVRPRKPLFSLEAKSSNPPEEWKALVQNDFEETIFKEFPELSGIKESLYAAGALYASMSGSGAAVYGIFREKVHLPELEGDCRVFYDAG
ncbi:4-diphosphocytidyl-2-C-methyl-D-erythritol kinase [Anseongella ginsenosidimutans]|uniref:4-diphosphocytidyl-2-C-methyl-D-erythritol kinase n=1 Tax=Anseongella ginsenosidimutans TaxID=496056 RepID=A0A4R3KSH7_9SPHI|nr:4-(cytidine 5'-diphospho)-2-C-methyl-D-erythritol kinase [Anseongella ginsenosidimutans]QEC53118.1 4-(cytidine 5'-diphospho)-2-C-methyl-D-erythritol kinase [Anseongella ginsenosidimutans]TCS87736.1 4-diphosphocytidyl-2-C-methyl-D-erythritol kinase [Anseongella ginsenosidimutans]